MIKLATFALAATAAFAASAAAAQPPSAPPPPPRPGVTWHGQGAMHHGAFPHRLQRGFVVPPFFASPQYVIGNWQRYGFAQPGPDQRWIRYYDDAYLIDRDGRIVDTREGMDWDRYGAHWAGEGDMPRHEVDERVRTYVYGAPGYGVGYPPPPPPPAYYGYGAYGSYGAYGGYGYGAYGYGAPIVVETTVYGGGGYTEEVTEEYERVQTPRRVHRARPRCICRPAPRPRPRPVQHRPAPRPPAGERG